MTFALKSERSRGFAVLEAIDSNLDGAQALSHGLPAGFGDVELWQCEEGIQSIATMMATPENFGPRWELLTGSSVADVIGAVRWTRDYTLQLAGRLELYYPRLWRVGEVLRISFDEVDTNASPTADAVHTVYVRRLRGQRPTVRPTRQATERI